MKKLTAFLRSMRFGLLLLLPVLVCSVAGSVIPQGESESYYAAAFPKLWHLILGLGLDKVFSGPVFLILTALFGLNLTLCTVSQFHAVPARRRSLEEKALRAEKTIPLGPGERKAAENFFRKRLWRADPGENGDTLFTAPAPAWYGSVITHFALLGILLGAVGIFGMTKTGSVVLFPGENRLTDGTVIVLNDFQIRDDAGRIEYASSVEIVTPAGKSSGPRQIRVNHPLRFGGGKYYQQSYGTAGQITVTVRATGEIRTLYMRESGMISAGGASAIWYDNVYPGYVIDEAGNFSVLTSADGEYPDPVYYLLRMEDGVTTPMMALPGDSVELADALYLFGEPVTYPVLQVKNTPLWIYGLLYLSFAAVMLGLYLCFFAPAACAVLGEEGAALVAKSTEELEQRLKLLGKREENV